MSYCRQEGKDTIIFATKEDHEVPPKIEFGEIEEEGEGLILPNGDINWNCPCLGGMATGPCGVEFREAFSCFHYSESEPKGSECLQPFREMQECMVKYPTLYPTNDDDDEGDRDSLDNSDPLAEAGNTPSVDTSSGDASSGEASSVSSKNNISQHLQSSDKDENSSV